MEQLFMEKNQSGSPIPHTDFSNPFSSYSKCA